MRKEDKNNMINVDEAIAMTKKAHNEAYQVARQKWVPYWMDFIDHMIRKRASEGDGTIKVSLKWTERISYNERPDSLVQKYTEQLLDKELEKSEYIISKITDSDDSFVTYRITWLTEEYNACEE